MHYLKDENWTLIIDKAEIATLGTAIEESSSSEHYSKDSQSVKARKVKKINLKQTKIFVTIISLRWEI